MSEHPGKLDSFAVRRPILVPVGVALVAFVLLFSLLFRHHIEAREAEHTHTIIRHANAVLEELLQNNLRQLQWFSQHASVNPEIVAAMKNGQRDALLALTEKRLSSLRQSFGISHWYFITPDQHVLLRVHDPEQAGDRIERETMRRAVRSDLPASGLELGNTATYTLRYVMPWIDDGRLLGYIEMGMEVAWFSQSIEKLLDVRVMTAIDKRKTSATAFSNGKRALGLSGNWQDFPDFALLDQSLPTVPAVLV